MKRLKLSKKLSLDKKIFVLMMTTLIGILNLSTTIVVAEDAEPSTTAPNQTTDDRANNNGGTAEIVLPNGTTMKVTMGAEGSAADESAKSCEKINDDFSERMREMVSACRTSGFRGNCLEALFQCRSHSDTDSDLEDDLESDSDYGSDSQTCVSFNKILDSKTSEEQDKLIEAKQAKIDRLEQNKKDTQTLRDQEQESLDDLNSNYAERKTELFDLRNEFQKSIDQHTGQYKDKIAAINSSMIQIQDLRDQTFTELLKQQSSMDKFMLESRAKCYEQAQLAGSKYVTLLRKNGNSISLQSLIRAGNKSYSDIRNAYERQQVRKCLRTDAQTAFAAEYQQRKKDMNTVNSLIRQKNNEISNKFQELSRALALAQAENNLANWQTQNKQQEAIKDHELETQRLQMKIKETSDRINVYNQTLSSIDNEIRREELAKEELETDSSSILSSDELNQLREAMATAESLIDEAKAARKSKNNCTCADNTALQTISNRSGVDFCEVDETEQQEQESDDIVEIQDDSTN